MKSLFATKEYQQTSVSEQEKMISRRSRTRAILREGRFLLRSYEKSLCKNEMMLREEIQAFQLEKLRRLVKFSSCHVPYYKRLFKRIGFSYRDCNSLAAFQDLPYLTKEMVRRQINDFRPRHHPYHWFYVSGGTSGTTGTPLKVFHSPVSIIRERAFQKRLLKWTGCNHGEKKVWLRGDLIVPIRQKKPPFWRFNKTENQLMMSSYHISEDSLDTYVQALYEFGPSLISAYPSALYSIASYMKSRNYKTLNVKAIVTSSETLYPEWRKTIEEVFCCRVFDWYGSYERVAAFCSCTEGNYHVIEDYGYTEFAPIDDSFSEIVSTGFHNYAMPLIRYKTGDLLRTPQKSDHDYCICGSRFRFVYTLSGRKDDFIVLKNNRKFQRMDFIFKDFSIRIREGQVYQYEDHSIEIRVVPQRFFSDEDKRMIKKNALERLGQDAKVEVVCMDTLPRTKSGKLKSVISEVVQGL